MFSSVFETKGMVGKLIFECNLLKEITFTISGVFVLTTFCVESNLYLWLWNDFPRATSEVFEYKNILLNFLWPVIKRKKENP